jgi:hypothetical protein
MRARPPFEHFLALENLQYKVQISKSKHKEIDVLTLTGVFTNQKKLNVSKHTVKMALY